MNSNCLFLIAFFLTTLLQGQEHGEQIKFDNSSSHHFQKMAAKSIGKIEIKFKAKDGEIQNQNETYHFNELYLRELDQLLQMGRENQGKIEEGIVIDEEAVTLPLRTAPPKEPILTRLEKILLIAAQSQGKIKVTYLPSEDKTAELNNHNTIEQEFLRRLKKIKKIAADSQGKIEIKLLPSKTDSVAPRTSKQLVYKTSN